ncbi:MAG: transposase [Candidatus Nezhaarchaeales archaeon]
MHGKKKRYIKIHFSVDVKTKEVLAMEVTTDDVHDLKALPALIKDASKLRRVSEAVMDGAYDNSKAYRLLRRMNVKPILSLGITLELIEAFRKDVERLGLSSISRSP